MQATSSTGAAPDARSCTTAAISATNCSDRKAAPNLRQLAPSGSSTSFRCGKPLTAIGPGNPFSRRSRVLFGNTGAVESDRWGVPRTMFGDVPEDFYGLVGRMTLVAGLLEDRLHVLFCALARLPQDCMARGVRDRVDQRVP